MTNSIELPDAPAFDLDHWMIAWDRDSGHVEVGQWPDETGWSKHLSTAGCCFAYWKTLTRKQKVQELVNGLFFLVLSERLDPQAVHRELWKIRDYRKLKMSPLGMGSYIMFQGKGRCDPYNP